MYKHAMCGQRWTHKVTDVPYEVTDVTMHSETLDATDAETYVSFVGPAGDRWSLKLAHFKTIMRPPQPDTLNVSAIRSNRKPSNALIIPKFQVVSDKDFSPKDHGLYFYVAFSVAVPSLGLTALAAEGIRSMLASASDRPMTAYNSNFHFLELAKRASVGYLNEKHKEQITANNVNCISRGAPPFTLICWTVRNGNCLPVFNIMVIRMLLDVVDYQVRNRKPSLLNPQALAYELIRTVEDALFDYHSVQAKSTVPASQDPSDHSVQVWVKLTFEGFMQTTLVLTVEDRKFRADLDLAYKLALLDMYDGAIPGVVNIPT